MNVISPVSTAAELPKVKLYREPQPAVETRESLDELGLREIHQATVEEEEKSSDRYTLGAFFVALCASALMIFGLTRHS